MNAEQLLAHFDYVAEAPDAVSRLRSFVLDLAVRGKLISQIPTDEPASELLKRISVARERAPKSRRNTQKKLADSSLTELQFPLPTGWSNTQLSELVRVVNGRAYKKPELLDEGTPVLRVGNLFTSDHWYYSTLELDEDKYCDSGDLIYAWSASFGPFIWSGPRVIYHYHIWKMPLFSESDLDKQFLYLYLLQKTREIKNAGHGISMVHMTKEKMEQLVVPLPPLAEQRRIVARVDELMSLLDRLEATIKIRDTTRTRLLEALLADALNSESMHEVEAAE
ncbi:MAG: restriction endonuclease subunit S [Rhodocyclaceae bacterium]|nr:restriction endonuclease subunit S [Rhodocyclaceae bacterium]